MTMVPDTYKAPPTPSVPEDDFHRYARQTRNAVCFQATVLAVGLVICFIIGIVTAVQLSHLSNGLGSPTVSSSCSSQGGWDVTC